MFITWENVKNCLQTIKRIRLRLVSLLHLLRWLHCVSFEVHLAVLSQNVSRPKMQFQNNFVASLGKDSSFVWCLNHYRSKISIIWHCKFTNIRFLYKTEFCIKPHLLFHRIQIKFSAVGTFAHQKSKQSKHIVHLAKTFT